MEDLTIEVYNANNIQVNLEVYNKSEIDTETLNKIVEKARLELRNCFEKDIELLYLGLINYAFDFMSGWACLDSNDKLTTEDIIQQFSGKENDYYWEMANLEKKEDILNHMYDLGIVIMGQSQVDDILNRNRLVIGGQCDWEPEHGVGITIIDGRLKIISSYDVADSEEIETEYNYVIPENFPKDYIFEHEKLLTKTYKRVFNL